MRSVSRRTSKNLLSPPGARSRSTERSIQGAVFDFEIEPQGPCDSLENEDDLRPNRRRLTSESSLSKQVRSHRRVMSDPFDTADSGGITDGDQQQAGLIKDYGLLEEEENALPTLQRFPFAQTQDKNCWSEPNVDIFSIRGPNYLVDRKKVTAKRYILSARGCDLFLADKPHACNISR